MHALCTWLNVQHIIHVCRYSPVNFLPWLDRQITPWRLECDEITI